MCIKSGHKLENSQNPEKPIILFLCFSFVDVKVSLFVFVFLQVAQVLLTLPYSFSQLGMLSGIIFQMFYGIIGSWTAYLISILYVEYRTRKEKENVSFKNHVIQVRLYTNKKNKKKQNFRTTHWSFFFFLEIWRSCLCCSCLVVWSTGWVVGSILEGCWIGFQLYFPPLWICHSANSLCKVFISLHISSSIAQNPPTQTNLMSNGLHLKIKIKNSLNYAICF